MLTEEDMRKLYHQASEVLPVAKFAQEIHKIEPNSTSLKQYGSNLLNERVLWMLNQAYNKGKHDAST